MTTLAFGLASQAQAKNGSHLLYYIREKGRYSVGTYKITTSGRYSLKKSDPHPSYFRVKGKIRHDILFACHSYSVE